MITSLKRNQIFVFGSNLAGRHGKGAALQARKFGAIYGKGTGIQGQTWAIPTKDANLKTLPLSVVAIHVKAFLLYAQVHSELEFLVTSIGCGLARYKTEDIAPMFKNHSDNVKLPFDFVCHNQTHSHS